MEPASEDRCKLCNTIVDQDYYCYGCHNFICGEHATVWGRHEISEHEAEEWDEDDL